MSHPFRMDAVPEQVIIRMIAVYASSNQRRYAGLSHIHQSGNGRVFDDIIDQLEYIQARDLYAKTGLQACQGHFQSSIESGDKPVVTAAACAPNA